MSLFIIFDFNKMYLILSLHNLIFKMARFQQPAVKIPENLTMSSHEPV